MSQTDLRSSPNFLVIVQVTLLPLLTFLICRVGIIESVIGCRADETRKPTVGECWRSHNCDDCRLAGGKRYLHLLELGSLHQFLIS